ncbi:hypothetical protein Q1695_002876 [Nippostrongylus brasiliensis]|nr:hypothetical protein Q1695_002876 [Nippostrongylus brasiliensis]
MDADEGQQEGASKPSTTGQEETDTKDKKSGAIIEGLKYPPGRTPKEKKDGHARFSSEKDKKPSKEKVSTPRKRDDDQKQKLKEKEKDKEKEKEKENGAEKLGEARTPKRLPTTPKGKGKIDEEVPEMPRPAAEEKTDEDDGDAKIVIGEDGLKSNKPHFQWVKYGGKKKLSVFNNSQSIQALKIKCSDNSIFNVDPAITTIVPQETLTVKVHRMHSPIKADKLIIMTIPTVKEEKYIKELFKNPFATHKKVTITQMVDGKYIMAYYAPMAAGKEQCVKFASSKLLFNGAIGGDQSLRIENTIPRRIGFKIQCTNNRIFFFRPVFGIIEANDSFRIKVTRTPAGKSHDKMVVKMTYVTASYREAQLPSLFLQKDTETTEFAFLDASGSSTSGNVNFIMCDCVRGDRSSTSSAESRDESIGESLVEDSALDDDSADSRSEAGKGTTKSKTATPSSRKSTRSSVRSEKEKSQVSSTAKSTSSAVVTEQGTSKGTPKESKGSKDKKRKRKKGKSSLKKISQTTSEFLRKTVEAVQMKKPKEEDKTPVVVAISDSGMKCNRECVLWTNYGGTKTMSISNDTTTIQAVKIRCSDNALFRITPPMGCIQPKETLNVTIHRTHAPIKLDKLIVLAVATIKEEQHLKEIFECPFVQTEKVSIAQIVEGSGLLAYYAPTAPPQEECLRFSAVKLLFNGEVGGNQNLRITSTLKGSVGIKIQCTDNNLFWFRPVFGIIEPGETFRIKVTRSPHPKKRDKMIVCITPLKKGQRESHLPKLFLKKRIVKTDISIPLTCS